MLESSETIHVLHVDDEPDFSDMAATFLEREDDRFVIESETDVGEGLAYLDANDVDCVVSDHDMPGRNGIEFLESVREDHPDLPFILYTGKGSEEVASEAISAGVTDYLQKERGTDQYAVLANRITNAVAQYRAEHELEQTREYFRTVLEGASDYVMVLEPDGEIDYVSPAIQRVLGYDPEALTGEDVFEPVHPDDKPDATDTFSALRDTPDMEQTVEYRVQHADGSWRWLEVRARNLLADPVIEGLVVNVRDVTERKASELQLETVIDNLPGYVYRHRYEQGWPLEFVKGDSESVTGYTTAELEDEIVIAEQVIHPDDRTDVWEGVEAGLEAHDEFDLTYRIVTKDGEKRWVRDQGQLVADPTTGTEFIDGFVSDVTEQQEREQTLAAVKERYQAFVEGSRDVLTVLTTDGVIEYQSPAIETVLGYDQDELIDDTVFDYVHPEDRERIVAEFQQVQDQSETHTAVTEYRFKHGDGSWVWVESVASPRYHSAVGGYVVSSREITDRKNREHRLEALNRATRRLFTADDETAVAEIGVEVAQDVLELDANAVFLYDEAASALRPTAASDAVRDLLGEPPTFTGEGSIAWRAYQNGESLAVDDVHEDPDLYNPETPMKSELLLPLEDHGILIAGSPTADTFDRRDLVLGEILAANIATALTQIGKTEKLQARERELTRQNDRLEEVASIVSHDLRNPLNVAEARLALLSEECDSEHLDAIAHAHDRMGSLIEDMLTLARERRTATELESGNLAAITESCWRNVETANASLVTRTDRTIRADERQLKQLFENLVRNAVEHGGEDVTVTVGELEDGFYVEDDGPGIPADDRDEVFAVGYSTSEDGTGFGLQIVEQIADAHDWTVRLTEGADGGARFEITGVEFGE